MIRKFDHCSNDDNISFNILDIYCAKFTELKYARC